MKSKLVIIQLLIAFSIQAQPEEGEIILFQKHQPDWNKKHSGTYYFEFDTINNTIYRKVLKAPQLKHNFNQFVLPSPLFYEISNADRDTLIAYLPNVGNGDSFSKGWGGSSRRTKFMYLTSDCKISLRIAKRSVNDQLVIEMLGYKDKFRWMLNKYYNSAPIIKEDSTELLLEAKDSVLITPIYPGSKSRNDTAQNAQSQPEEAEKKYVLKDYGWGKYSNNKKEGIWYHHYPYFKKKDTIAFGRYENNKMEGEWKFFEDGELVHVYDFTKDSLIFDKYRESEIWENPGSFDGQDRPSGLLADKRPVFKGGRVWLTYLVYSHFQLSEYMLACDYSLNSTLYYRIDETGQLDSLRFVRGGKCGMKEEHKRIARYLDQWIPAELNGQKVEAEVGFLFRWHKSL